MVEKEIAERIAAAKLRLRFDKVVVRLAARLKAALAEIVPEDRSLIITVTAPIRLPAKTADALENLARDGLEHGGLVHGNQVRVHQVMGVASSMPRVILLVHNPDSDADVILALAESRLRERG